MNLRQKLMKTPLPLLEIMKKKSFQFSRSLKPQPKQQSDSSSTELKKTEIQKEKSIDQQNQAIKKHNLEISDKKLDELKQPFTEKKDLKSQNISKKKTSR